MADFVINLKALSGWIHRPALGAALLILLFQHPAFAARLDHVQLLPDRRVELTGDFGAACADCEILVNYQGGFNYAYQPKRWDPRQLIFKIDDVGRSLKVNVSVITATGKTGSRSLVMTPRLTPPNLDKKLKHSNAIDNKTMFQRQHNDPFGGNGKDRFKLDSNPATCGKQEKRFQRAELIFGKKRFGDARVVRQPTPGCQKCTLLEVEWYHEPTGAIEYQLHVQQRIVDGLCRDRIR